MTFNGIVICTGSWSVHLFLQAVLLLCVGVGVCVRVCVGGGGGVCVGVMAYVLLVTTVRPPFVNSLFNVLFFAKRYAGTHVAPSRDINASHSCVAITIDDNFSAQRGVLNGDSVSL